MDLPTYTSIWRIEKRLYKLYDFRLPMPLPIGQVTVFAAVAVPYVVILQLLGLPFNHTLIWLYILPPGVVTWLATRPVLESKRLPELIRSQLRYLAEPKVICRMVPLAERDVVVVTGRVWRPRTRRADSAPAGDLTAGLFDGDLLDSDVLDSDVLDRDVQAGEAPGLELSRLPERAFGRDGKPDDGQGWPEPGLPAAASAGRRLRPLPPGRLRARSRAGAPERALADTPVPPAAAMPPAVAPEVAAPAAAGRASERATAGRANERAVAGPTTGAPSAWGPGASWPAVAASSGGPAGTGHAPARAEFAGAERAGAERAGAERAGAERAGAERAEAEPAAWAAAPVLDQAGRRQYSQAGRAPRQFRGLPARSWWVGQPGRLAGGSPVPGPQPEAEAYGQLGDPRVPGGHSEPAPASEPVKSGDLAHGAGTAWPDGPARGAEHSRADQGRADQGRADQRGADHGGADEDHAGSGHDDHGAAIRPAGRPAWPMNSWGSASAPRVTPPVSQPIVQGDVAEAPETLEAPDVPAAAHGVGERVSAATPEMPAVAPEVTAVAPEVPAATPVVPAVTAQAGSPVLPPHSGPAGPRPDIATGSAGPRPDIATGSVSPSPDSATGSMPPRPDSVTGPAPPRPQVTVVNPAAARGASPAVERALAGPSARRGDIRAGRVAVVPGGHRPGKPDLLHRDRSRAQQAIGGPARVVVLGCTVGAGQTMTALLTGDVLASLRSDRIAVLDLNPGSGSLARRAEARPALGQAALLTPSRLAVIAPPRPGANGPFGGAQNGPRADAELAFAAATDRYELVLADPATVAVPRLLGLADQLVLVAPASGAAPGAVAMTFEWLEAHGQAGLAAGAIMVLNGVSRRSIAHVEQAERVCAGRCRATVRVPWDDQLQQRAPQRMAPAGSPQARQHWAGVLSPATAGAFTALAGVLVASLADRAGRTGPAGQPGRAAARAGANPGHEAAELGQGTR